GALLRVDGRPLKLQTPVLLTDLKPGEHHFELLKAGYRTWSRRLPLTLGHVVSVPVRLEPDTSTLAFPEDQRLLLGGQSARTENKEFRIPDGSYRVRSVGNTVEFAPVFPDQTLLDATVWSLPVVSTLSILASLGDLSTHDSAGFPFSPTTVTSWGFVVGDVLWSVALNNSKVRFLNDHQLQIDPLPQARRAAASLFEEGKNALANGRLPQAAEAFAQIVKSYPDAVQTPGAWFYLARLHALEGDRALAKSEFRIDADYLQQANYYDKSCKALADLDQADGELLQAVNRLRSMVFVDPLFTRQEIEAQIQTLENQIKGAKR
ncbi:MAG: PEGA domain-containing protein, partial [Spirochaetales bacterium]|nr:PEGA domain-containing protein [Spirochaetales bacterium]